MAAAIAVHLYSRTLDVSGASLRDPNSDQVYAEPAIKTTGARTRAAKKVATSRHNGRLTSLNLVDRRRSDAPPAWLLIG